MQTIRRQVQCHKASDRKGAAIVEFAIIAPLFIGLVLGAIEGGQAFEAANLMSAALREGGRLACMDWDGAVPDGMTINQKVTADIRNFLVAAGMPGEAIDISIKHADGAAEGDDFDLGDADNKFQLFRISAKVPYADVSEFPATFMKGQTVAASIVFRAGRVSMTD